MMSLFQSVSHSNLYSKFRPSPPTSLVEEIIKYLSEKIDPPFKKAVDIGCGTGQSTVPLASYFQHVTGIDASESQIEQAKINRSAPNIEYKVSDAEETSFADSSVNLVTVAQAIHWFDMPKFFKEVQRILVPNGAVAVYGYWLPTPKMEDPILTKKMEDLLKNLHDIQLGPYWNEERCIVENHYADIKLPFKNCVRNTNITQKSTSTVSEYIGYLSSWSAYQKYKKEHPENAQSLLAKVQNGVSLAEETGFADSSIDLVTVAQAVHWFDMPKFFKEVQRILIPNGVLAVYGHCIPEPKLKAPTLSKELNDEIMNLLNEHYGHHWEKQRNYIQNRYADITLPFINCVRNPCIPVEITSTVSEYIGYLSSWSPYQKYQKEHPEKAQAVLDQVQNKLMKVVEVGSTPEEAVLNINTEFFVLMGTKESSPL